jgi:hypothetical protein
VTASLDIGYRLSPRDVVRLEQVTALSAAEVQALAQGRA